MTMTRRTMGVAAGALLAGALLLGGASVALARGLTAAPTGGMMGSTGTSMMSGASGTGMMGGASGGGMMGGASGGGMMGNGMMGSASGGGMMSTLRGSRQVTDPTRARALSHRVAATVAIDRQTNTITYHSAQVALVALASPASGPDMTWTVDGLVNPTVVIPQGASVSVRFFDADTDTMHGWEVTRTPPPYPYMAMMDAPVAFPGAFAMPVRGATARRWVGRVVRFTASRAGTYSYICPVPGHAQQGMHGTLVVRS